MNEIWVVCRHTRGGFHVWKLADVCRMNRQRMVRGEKMDDEWRPMGIAVGESEARALEVQMRREVRAFREAVERESGGKVPYPAAEAQRDLDGSTAV